MQTNEELQGKQDTYVVEGLLGEGGFGLTYRAYRKSDSCLVVLKLLRIERAVDWKSVELFEREAKVLERLSHPRIPQYLDTFALGDPKVPQGFGLVQSFIEGRTLKELMRAGERLSQEAMHRWLWQLLEVCAYLHQQSPPVIHRDISPKNIILRPSGDAVLIDFGTVQAKLGSSHSVSSTSAGTFGYAPMEQFVGRASPSSDLYGLAMTYLAVATGQEPEQLPFDGNRINVRRALANTTTDARILLTLDQMTHPDPAGRINSAQEVMERLRGIYQEARPAPRARDNAKTIVGRICFRCEAQVGFDDEVCGGCGSSLNPASWADEAPRESKPASVGQAVNVPPPPAEVSAWRAARGSANHWRSVKARLAQLTPEQLLPARPAIPLGDLEFVAINDAATHALLVTYEGFYLLMLREMKVTRLFTEEHISGRRGAFSPDGQKLLVADCYGPTLYFIDIPTEGTPQLRVMPQPELSDFRGDCAIAVSPDHQIAAIAGEGDHPILLFDWATGAVLDRVQVEGGFEDEPSLSFSPDGSLLLCGLRSKTLLFDTQGNQQKILAAHVAISPDGRRMAGVVYDEEESEQGLFMGAITRLSPFAWDPRPLKHRKESHSINALRFSADSKSLLAEVYLNDREDDHDALDIITTGQPTRTIDEPFYPNKCFSEIKHFAMDASGGLSIFARAWPSYYAAEALDALLLLDASSTPRLRGALQFAKRTNDAGGGNVFIGGKQVGAGALGPNVIINQAPITNDAQRALAMFAAPDGDPDVSLPFGSTATGYFGRLDATSPLGPDWSCALEHPELAQRVLQGDQERELLAGYELHARDDLEERLRFWHSLRGPKTNLRALVNACAGLTHLLPDIVSRAAAAAKGKARFGRGDNTAPSDASILAACKELASYSEAEREVLFQEMCARLDAEEAPIAASPKAQPPKPERPATATAPSPTPSAPTPIRRADTPPKKHLASLEELGLYSDSYITLLLLPLCEILWADGTPQPQEVKLVSKYAESLAAQHPIIGMGLRWAMKAPDASVFEKGRTLLRELVLEGQYPGLTRERLREVLKLCHQIASASGGFLGLGKVSKEEKSALAKIEETLTIDD